MEALAGTDSKKAGHLESAEAARSLGAGERYVMLALFCVMLALRVAYAFRFRFDTDEPQHLHVVWGWVNGLLPYRDVFDNHGPLFHALCAPLLGALGERADSLILMRLAMIPLFAISLWCVFQIGKALSSSRLGVWAVLFAGFYPEFFFTSAEFRTDDLWTVLWLLAMVFATRRIFTKMNAFLIGLLVGMAFCVTVKSGLLVGALIFGGSGVVAHRWLTQRTIDLPSIAVRAAIAAVGFVIVPSAWFAFFAMHGAAKEFLYCNITHNLVPRAQNWQHLDAHLLWFPVFFLVALGTLFVFRKQAFDSVESRRLFLVFTAGAYFCALKSFFPTLTRQDDLPFIPLACIGAALLLEFLAVRMSSRMTPGKIMARAFPVIAALEVLFIVVSVPLSRNGTTEEIWMIDAVLKTTQKSDYVMDATGEAVFRRRAYYYALEAFTKVRIDRGLIVDSIVEDMIRTRTAVVLPWGLTKKAKLFVHENYLAVGHGVSMLGQRMPSGGSASPVSFKIAIPGNYRMVKASAGDVTGSLDGTAVNGPRFLDVGEHTFQNATGDYSGVCVFWNPGFEKGFVPLAKQESAAAD